MSVEMWRFPDDINTRRFNAVARMQPHCPVLYSGNENDFSEKTDHCKLQFLA
jgi:hypothetical protein